MLVEIENAVIKRLEDNGLDVQELDLKGTGDGSEAEAVKRCKLPAVFVALAGGRFEKKSDFLSRMEARILVAVAFKHAVSGRKRRHGAYVSLEAIAGLLANQKLGLDIDPITPGRWYDITDRALAQAGIALYQVEMNTFFDFETVETIALHDLLLIHVDYDLAAGDGEPGATDDITLQGGS